MTAPLDRSLASASALELAQIEAFLRAALKAHKAERQRADDPRDKARHDAEVSTLVALLKALGGALKDRGQATSLKAPDRPLDAFLGTISRDHMPAVARIWAGLPEPAIRRVLPAWRTMIEAELRRRGVRDAFTIAGALGLGGAAVWALTK